MNKPSLTNREYIGVTPKETVEKIPYPKEQVEHLVDQLIKLQRAYDLGNSISSKAELTAGMKSINKALEGSLMHRLVIKP